MSNNCSCPDCLLVRSRIEKSAEAIMRSDFARNCFVVLIVAHRGTNQLHLYKQCTTLNALAMCDAALVSLEQQLESAAEDLSHQAEQPTKTPEPLTN